MVNHYYDDLFSENSHCPRQNEEFLAPQQDL
jgi:hypothetical protein